MNPRHKGTLILIGGNEDKEGERTILKEVVAAAAERTGPLVLITAATGEPAPITEKYLNVFSDLGVQHLEVVDIRSRQDACQPENVQKVARASAVFFTGGDQLRITSQIGDSPVFRSIRAFQESGGLVAGTSAGAAAMPETMLIGGAGDTSHDTRDLSMAPGLGFLAGVTIDSHFAERGRIGRLLGAVARNPKNIGLGLDEDTAVVVHQCVRMRVVGAGALYIIDGTEVSYSSLSEEDTEGILTIHDVKLHVLAPGQSFDLSRRRPLAP